MKKLLAIALIFCLMFLSGCNTPKEGITFEENDKYVKITLDSFEGEEKIKLTNKVGEGSLYYLATVTSGSLSLSYSEGWFGDDYILFTIDAENTHDGGAYVSGGKITITVSAEEATSGSVLIAFSNTSSPFN